MMRNDDGAAPVPGRARSAIPHDRNRRGPTWMEERLLGRSKVELDAELRRQSFQHALQREEVCGLAATPP